MTGLKWTIGNVEILQIIELSAGNIIQSLIKDATPRNIMQIKWTRLQTNFLQNLNKTGVSEENVDIVICTHLHCDHVGWNTKHENGIWKPTFPTAGHTPSHVSVLVESQTKKAIISGDILHHPCQIARPEWLTDGDTMPQKALATRRKILEEIADTNTLLIGSHFPNPVAGHVRRSKEGFVFEA